MKLSMYIAKSQWPSTIAKNGMICSTVHIISLARNSSATNIAMRKVAVSLADSVDLRIILSVLYIITEVIRNEKMAGSSDFKDIAETFSNELSKLHREVRVCGANEMISNSFDTFSHSQPDAPIGDELLAVKLLNMITRFCGGTAPHFPMKKVLLLLWKISLVSLGGMDTLRKLKGKMLDSMYELTFI